MYAQLVKCFASPRHVYDQRSPRLRHQSLSVAVFSSPVSNAPTAIPTAQPNAHPVPACYPGMDTTSCPVSCPSGQYCDGARCVPRSECPCSLDNKVIRVSIYILHCGLIKPFPNKSYGFCEL